MNFDKFYKTSFRKYYAISFAAIFLGLFIELTWEFWEKDHALRLIDLYVLHFFESIRINAINGPAIDITAIGSSTTSIILSIIVLSVLLLARDKLRLTHYLAALLGSAFWTVVIKHLFGRSRPTEISQLINVTGFSYPSGHTLISASIYLTLVFFGFRFFTSLRSRIVLLLLASLLIGLIGLSRIYLGVHYPSDVLAGACFGTGWALMLQAFFSTKYNN